MKSLKTEVSTYYCTAKSLAGTTFYLWCHLLTPFLFLNLFKFYFKRIFFVLFGSKSNECLEQKEKLTATAKTLNLTMNITMRKVSVKERIWSNKGKYLKYKTNEHKRSLGCLVIEAPFLIILLETFKVRNQLTKKKKINKAIRQ